MKILNKSQTAGLTPKIPQGSCVLFDGKYRFVGYSQGDEVLLVHPTEEPVIVHPTQCILAPGVWVHAE